MGVFVPDRADLVGQIKEDVVKEVENRGIENLSISTQELGVGTTTQALVGEKREHIVFEQKLGGGTKAGVALRIAPQGDHDLELSWRLLEGNPTKTVLEGGTQTGLVIFGVLWTLMSIALIPLGVGFCTVIIGPIIIGFGMGWWGKNRGKTKATTYQQLDSRALAQAVDYSLMKTLEELGLAPDEEDEEQKKESRGLMNTVKRLAMSIYGKPNAQTIGSGSGYVSENALPMDEGKHEQKVQRRLNTHQRAMIMMRNGIWRQSSNSVLCLTVYRKIMVKSAISIG